MFQLALDKLTADSTLADLPTHDFQVNVTTCGQVVAEHFQSHPELPGVIITDGSQLVGMISRQRFVEKMSQPYSLELYRKRPIQAVLETMKNQPLHLPHDDKIDDAARSALARPVELLYEPIIVVDEAHQMRLLDLHSLLVSQSQILVLVNEIAHQQRLEAQEYSARLNKEKEKVKEYTRILEARRDEIQKRNHELAAKQAELVKQEQQISDLNKRFVQISQLLCTEGKKAFQATFDSVKTMNRSTNQIIYTGKALAGELETVNAATKMIENVSKQVMHLGVKAAVVANQAGGQVSSFSQVVTEISNLGSQTLAASNKVNQIANRFKARIQELTAAAGAGESKSQAVIPQIQRAEKALEKLEGLLNEQNCAGEKSSGVGVKVEKAREQVMN